MKNGILVDGFDQPIDTGRPSIREDMERAGCKPHFAESSKSDELRSIGSFSVLSEPDRKIVEIAGRWLRHMWLEATPGYSMKLDGIDHDAVYDAMRQVEGLLTRTLPEPALSRVQIDREGVCGSCGGRTINGFCRARCER